ncbi:MAG: hypothetical protein EOO24_06175, partial [Comamonadaceae bacterium]
MRGARDGWERRAGIHPSNSGGWRCGSGAHQVTQRHSDLRITVANADRAGFRRHNRPMNIAPGSLAGQRRQQRRASTGATALIALVALVAAGLPGRADAVFRCLQQGRVSFQDEPCPNGAVQSSVRLPGASEPIDIDRQDPNRLNATASKNPLDPVSPSTAGITDPAQQQERLDIARSESARREAADTLRDLSTRSSNQQAVCERYFGATFSRNADPQRSINGATYPQNPL